MSFERENHGVARHRDTVHWGSQGLRFEDLFVRQRLGGVAGKCGWCSCGCADGTPTFHPAFWFVIVIMMGSEA